MQMLSTLSLSILYGPALAVDDGDKSNKSDSVDSSDRAPSTDVDGASYNDEVSDIFSECNDNDVPGMCVDVR